MRAILLSILLALLFTGCGEKTQEKTLPQEDALQQAKAWVEALDIDLNLIAQKGYGEKKRIAEILGVYWKFYHYASAKEQKQIKSKIKAFYQYTHKETYLNLSTLDDKAFRKNSMSFLRVMWILKEMGWDIRHLHKAFAKIKPRMDAHLARRGPWQKSMFARYYDDFGFDKPTSITEIKGATGLIGAALPLAKYNTIRAYQFTHQIFVAFNYGLASKQTRFNTQELGYIQHVFPSLIHHYQKKKNWDLLAELLSGMVYLKLTKNPEFEPAYQALIKAQNPNGSWGEYSQYRKKYGDSVELKYYLHTTGVAIETLIEKMHRQQ